ncbi:MAG: DUF2161 family putative PD-(D/E)XK-type phosphodiesterase [Pseudomonadota bacterium]
MSEAATRETDLYPPIKAFLETQGYTVKAEVEGADVVAHRDGDEPVVVELKMQFSLALLLQAIERQRISACVYVAVPDKAGAPARKARRAHMTLCRRLGIGLLSVRLSDGFVEPLLDPAPYRPRVCKRRRGRMLREFHKRVGDPNTGGSTRRMIMTAYRQDAIRCACALAQDGATKASQVAAKTGVARARRIMADDHYGWFERVAVGVYQLTPKGRTAVAEAPALGPPPEATERAPEPV